MKNYKPILQVLLIFISSSIYAQEYIDFKYSRDFKRILEMTKVDSSELFYPKLFERFRAADSTLTNYEILALQIGYTDNDNYWPYQDVEMEREIWRLNEQKEYEKAIQTCDTLLSRNPFSILAFREKYYAYYKLGQQDSADYYYERFEKIVLCDLSTGDGKSYKTSWFVLSPADGQWIIKLAFQGHICFMGSGMDNDDNFHDILGYQSIDDEKKTKKKRKKDDCLHLYFNIEHAVKRMFGKGGLEKIEEILNEGSN